MAQTRKVNVLKLKLPEASRDAPASWGELIRSTEQWSEQVRLRLLEIEKVTEVSFLRALIAQTLVAGTSVAITTAGASVSLKLTISKI